MKFTVCLLTLFVCAIAWAAPDIAQKISLTAKSTSATSFLGELSKKADVTFLVDEKITFHKAISMDVKDVTLKSVLDHFAKSQGVTWSVAKGYIKISQKK